MHDRSTVLLAALLGFGLIAGVARADTLRIGLAEDPNLLDPAQSGTLGERFAFASLCDKLVDISPKGEIVPFLATSWTLSPDQKQLTMTLRKDAVFHDGEKVDAAAVQFNIDRAKNLPESKRKAELAPVSSVDVVDEFTVRFNLAEPFAPLLAQLSDRAGMIVSPKAARAMKPADFANHPVCSGPFTLVQRIPQERIVMKKFEKYWNAANVHFDEVQIVVMPDAVVRLANVQSGQLDIAERIQATDLARGQADKRIVMYTVPSLSYNHLHINTNKPPRNNTPLAQNAKLREALDLAIDRKALVQAVSNGVFLPGNQLEPPTSPYYIKEFPVQPRNVARARELIKEAGFTRVPVNMQILNATLDLQVAQIVQAMAREVGFDITIEPQETGTAVARYFAGDFELFGGLWSGRVDPDGNIPTFLACDAGQNFSKYCNPDFDKLLNAARRTSNFQERYDDYKEATKIYLTDRPTIPIFHQVWVFAASAKLQGFVPYVDDIVRPVGLSLAK
jgi:peptide/nickel transport system substrate-binding protein